MSVLSFPRIYFKGFMEWDPCTFNNNDWQEFPTYDATAVSLNWPFLATQGAQVPPGITRDNFTTTFRPWAIALQQDAVDNPPGARIPAEWNMFGTHGVSFVQYNDFTSTIVGADLGYGQPVESDPLIGQPISINGDGGGGPGRLVDTNPASPWSSQIYFGQIGFGSGATTITGTRAFRMHSRWLNPARIYSTDQSLVAPAASIGAVFQTCITFGSITWPAAGSSQLATTLQQDASQPGALGLMIRFAAYVNLYFANGIFNGNTATRDYPSLAAALATAWAAWNNGGDSSQFFSQPCYSHVVGAIGVWNEGELASVPGGRSLSAAAAVAPVGIVKTAAAAPHRDALVVGHELKLSAVAVTGSPVPLGPVAVNVDYGQSMISLDLSSTIPENGTPGQWPSDLSKADFGPLSFGVMQNGTFIPIAQIDYAQYQRSAYEAKAGIIDIPFPDMNTGQLLETWPIAIQVQGQTALAEHVYAAQTDTRGIYLDQNGQAEFAVSVFASGAPSPGANLMVAVYDADLNLVPSGAQYVTFTNGTQVTVTVPNPPNPAIAANVQLYQTGQNGASTIGIAAQSPGFPVLAFFPFTGETLPQPPLQFSFVDDAYYTTVRVLPFDDALPQTFVDAWNANHDQAAAWNFVYNEILYLYDMLFNVMLIYVDLGSRQAVEQSLSSIWPAISAASAVESTYAMPITRDMSAGKRLTLQLWIYLAANQYNVQNFSVASIPPGWSPS